MYKYEIVAEGHCGVADIPEQILGIVEAMDEIDALYSYSLTDSRVKWIEGWNRYGLGPYGNRKVFARCILKNK